MKKVLTSLKALYSMRHIMIYAHNTTPSLGEPLMRKFSSYGPIDTDLHYYAPRKALLAHAYTQLMGDDPEKGGHYITVWAPRQVGKTWTMQQILFQLRRDDRFDAVKINLETVKMEPDLGTVLSYISKHLTERLGKEPFAATNPEAFEQVFTRNILEKPLILFLPGLS